MHQSRRRRTPGAKGFSLIELLVVVAVLGLLATMLVPSLVRAKRASHRIKCSKNLHSFGQAAMLYVKDNDGWLPRDDYSDAMEGWFWPTAFSPYMSDDGLTWDEIRDSEVVKEYIFGDPRFTCPGVEYEGREPGLDYAVNNFNWEVYRRNIADGHGLDDELYKYPGMDKEANATLLYNISAAPSSMLYIPEASRRLSIGFVDLHSDSHTMYNRYGEPAGGRVIRPDDTRHLGDANFLAFDGHVQTRRMTRENFPMRLYIPDHLPYPDE
ncbi:MAG: type II secretion system protein [Planctomycetota bacterium]